MTEKEKAEAYDEAIERAKKLYGNGIIEEIFPELKESKDKKIREAILKGLIDCRDAPDLGWSNFGGIHIDDCIDWLERQGKKSTAKIEPKFKVGDWVIFITYGSIYQVEKIENYEYTLRDIHGGSFCVSFSNEKLIREWNIQDVKDGDVLSFYSEYKGNKMVQVGIIEKYVGKHGGCSNTFKIHVGVNWDNNLQMGKYMGCSDIHPATKEQRDLLSQKIKDAGYKWNDETKALEKLEDFGKVGKSSFHEGDWVVYNNDVCQIVKREEGCNKLVTVFGIEKELVNERNLSTARLWTIQDAKDGEVLAADECYVVFKEIDGLNIKCHCTYHYLGLNPSFYIDTLQNKDAFLPATKEQRDTLMKAMNDAGYEWDAEKKELKKKVK